MLRVKLLLVFSILYIQTIAQEWQLLTPLTTSSDVQGCSFLDEQRGFMVKMTAGDIYRTSDGGMSWDKIWAPVVTGNLYDIEYVNQDTLFVCGSNGGLFRSSDGGNSWVDLNPPTIQWLYRLHFLNSQTGFACGFNGTLLRTADGGDSWQEITTGTTNRLWGMAFPNDTTGFVSGWNGTILKTMDGGLNWAPLTSGSTASFQSVSFVDEMTGFVCGSSGTILKTTNGGTSWTQQISGGSNTLHYIHFRNASVGWAAGSLGTYYTTSNGGTTWNTAGSLGSNDILCGAYVSGNASFLMGDRQISKSTNNGSTWQVIKNAVTNSRFDALWFQSDLIGTAVGSVGVLGEGNNQTGIVQTTDGGQTWSIRQQGSGGGWYAVHFPTSTTGYVAGSSGLGKTTNGGTSWTYSSPFTSASPECMWFTSDQIGCVATTLGSTGICKTTNGGSTFSCGTNQPGSAMQFVNANVGYTVHTGSASTFFKTTDGGTTWVNMPGMGGVNSSLHFISETEGWVGSASTVWHTTDGGLNWTEAYAGGADYVIAIHFYTPTTGFLVDNYGGLFKSTDGGETWDLVLVGEIALASAQFTENYCYGGGFAGEIFRAELECGAFQAGNIIGDDEWCENHIGIFSVGYIEGVTSYDWTLPDGWTGAANAFSIQPIASDQSGLVSVTVTNTCGFQSTVYYDVTVTPLVETPVIVGPSTVCSGGTATYTVVEDVNATTYDWSVTVGAFTENGDHMTINSAQQSGTVYVQSGNECGVSSWVSASVGLAAPPVVTWSLEDDFCVSDLITLNGGLPAGGTYSGPGVVDGVFDPSSLGEGNYTLNYHYESTPGCAGDATQEVTVFTSVSSPANFNNDCEVDDLDLLVLMEQFGCLGNCSADLNNSGVVGTDDLMILMGMLTN